MSRTFLVTGGAGFIGSHVVERLLASHERVICVDNFDDYYSPALKHQRCQAHWGCARHELIEADIRDGAGLCEIFERHRPTVVIHLAARAGVRGSMDHPVEWERTNVQGTISVLEAARRYPPVRIVNASSSSVYGDGFDDPAQEDRPLAPASPYGATKLAAEAMCRVYARQFGMSIASLRFFTVYGPRQRPDMAISRFARRILQGDALPIYGDGSMCRDFTFVSDIVDGIVAAANAVVVGHEAVNLGSGATVTIEELVELLGSVIGRTPITSYLPEQPGDVQRTQADIQKARQLLGFAPKISLREGLQRFVATLQAELHEGRDAVQGRRHSMASGATSVQI